MVLNIDASAQNREPDYGMISSPEVVARAAEVVGSQSVVVVMDVKKTGLS